MKHDWEYKKLGEVAIIKGRIGFRGYTKNDLVEKGKGAITLSPANIIDYKVSYEKCQYISWFKYEESPEIMIFNGDIIFAKTASIGKVALVNGLPDKATINPQFVVLKELKCNNKYLYYTLRSDTFKQSISLITNGVAIPTVSQSNMGNIPIPVPPLPIQQQIVAELDKVSEIIEKKKQQVKELDNLAQSIFYDMFGDPVENEKGWEVYCLGDICEIGTGATPSRENHSFFEGDIPWVKTTEVNNCRITNTEEHISSIAIDVTNCKLYPPETILLAMYGQGKTRGQVAVLDISAATNQACAAIQLPKNQNVTFHFCQLRLLYHEIRNMAQGCNQSNLNLKIVRKIKVNIPPLPLQQSFAQKVEAIEKQKELITASIKEAQTLFDARMDYWFGE